MFRIPLVVMVVALGAAVLAETTTHSSFHVPDGNNHNTFAREGCLQSKTVVVTPFENERIDKNTFYIEGADFEVRCLKWPAAPENVIAEVALAGSNSVRLTWSVPTTRQNGDPLPPDEIAGYVLIYGPSDGSGVLTVTLINNGATTAYTAERLGSGEYMFSVMTLDTGGNRSTPSAFITAVLP